MSEIKSEVMKCNNPNSEVPMCRECQRGTKSDHNEYEVYPLKKTTMNGYQCDAYLSKRETETLF